MSLLYASKHFGFSQCMSQIVGKKRGRFGLIVEEGEKSTEELTNCTDIQMPKAITKVITKVIQYLHTLFLNSFYSLFRKK